jgi:hypothetical protein
MTEKEEEKMTLQIPYKYFLHILHAVPIYCPQNTNLQKVNRIVLLCSFYLQYWIPVAKLITRAPSLPATSIYGRLGALFLEIHMIPAISEWKDLRMGNSQDRPSPPLVSSPRSFFFCNGGCSFLFKDLRGLSIFIPALNFSTPALKSDHRSVEV